MAKTIERWDMTDNELVVNDVDLGYQHDELTEDSGKLKAVLDEILTRLAAAEGA